MMVTEVDFVEAISHLHGCNAEFDKTVQVVETF